MASTLWWNQSIEETVQNVGGDINLGLSASQVERRQVEVANVIGEAAGPKPWRIILDQFTDTMVLVLLGATVVSGIIGDMVDAVTIMTIVIINAVLGFIQEYKAERALEEIKKLAAPYALVLRDGQKQQIVAADLVVGDLVLLEAGDKIPADMRIIVSHSMEIVESALTGESVPVEKRPDARLAAECPLGDRVNMAFMGTAVTRGRGSGIVIGIGMQTVMGEIAGMMREAESGMTPLQLKLDQLGKILIVICLLVCTLVAGMGIWRGEGFLTMFMAGISLAVAAIPEGLPAIVTVVLALGVQRMAKRNAIVRKLPAVETLGCTTVICSDKTGTLTRNQMTVKQVATLEQFYTIEGEGYQPQGRILGRDGKNHSGDKAMNLLLEIALNCNNSELTKVNGHYEIQGDPTEGALLVLAAKGHRQSHQKVIREIPFDSDRKRMSVVVGGDEQHLFVKGALDIIIDSCHWAI
jgi:Ca2+-transporting ATPase